MSLGDQIMTTLIDGIGVFISALIEAAFAAFVTPFFEMIYSWFFPAA